MTTDDQIRDEKLKYNINIQVAKISALSSGKNDKYEYLIGEKTLPSNQKEIIKQAQVPYYFGKNVEEQTKEEVAAIKD